MLEPASRNFLAKIQNQERLDLSIDGIKNTRVSMTQAHKFCFKTNAGFNENVALKQVKIKSIADGSQIKLYIYKPLHNKENKQLGLYLHGGGWCTGSLESFGLFAQRVAVTNVCTIVGVEYRLAPEYGFGTALQDCISALRWLIQHYGIKPFVMGDSAGGNLAAALCLTNDNINVSSLLLLCPLLDPCNKEMPSRRAYGQGDYLLCESELKQFCDLYQPVQNQRTNPLFAPVLAKDLSKMPPTLILTAQYDMLCDEGKYFADLLHAADVHCDYFMFRDTIHDFMVFGDKIPLSHSALKYIRRFLQKQIK